MCSCRNDTFRLAAGHAHSSDCEPSPELKVRLLQDDPCFHVRLCARAARDDFCTALESEPVTVDDVFFYRDPSSPDENGQLFALPEGVRPFGAAVSCGQLLYPLKRNPQRRYYCGTCETTRCRHATAARGVLPQLDVPRNAPPTSHQCHNYTAIDIYDKSADRGAAAAARAITGAKTSYSPSTDGFCRHGLRWDTAEAHVVPASLYLPNNAVSCTVSDIMRFVV